MIFQWEFYVNNCKDLNLKNLLDSWNHWNAHGKKEERVYADIPIFFNWENYLTNNKDLVHITTEADAWRHFLYYGRKENRNIENKIYIKKYCI